MIRPAAQRSHHRDPTLAARGWGTRAICHMLREPLPMTEKTIATRRCPTWIINWVFVVVALVVPAETHAQIRAWHTAEPLTPNASVIEQGSSWDGWLHSLDLRCDKSLGPCSWRITTQLGIANGTGKSYDLWIRDPAGNATTLAVSQTSIAGSSYSEPEMILENAPNGVLSRIQASSPVQLPAAAPYFMHSFVLTDFGTHWSGTTSLIAASEYGFTGTGPGTDPAYATRPTGIDNNPIIQNVWLYQEWPNPVINIQSVPEPATAAMLLAPALLLHRRRRKREDAFAMPSDTVLDAADVETHVLANAGCQLPTSQPAWDEYDAVLVEAAMIDDGSKPNRVFPDTEPENDGFPGTPALSYPAHNATGVSTTVTLTWVVSDETDCYQIRFGTTNDPPPLLPGCYPGTQWQPAEPLEPDTTYYWRVISNDSCGHTTSSSQRSFTTGS